MQTLRRDLLLHPQYSAQHNEIEQLNPISSPKGHLVENRVFLDVGHPLLGQLPLSSNRRRAWEGKLGVSRLASNVILQSDDIAVHISGALEARSH